MVAYWCIIVWDSIPNEVIVDSFNQAILGEERDDESLMNYKRNRFNLNVNSSETEEKDIGFGDDFDAAEMSFTESLVVDAFEACPEGSQSQPIN